MYEHERQVQIHKNEGFTVLSNGFIRDKNLSNRALGLLTFMLSLPPNWDYSIAGLTKVRKEGYEAIKNTIKELIDLNYIRRDKIRLSNGRFKHIYHIYDEPVANELKMEFLPEGTFPGVVEPSVVNQQEINKEEISKNNKDKHENIDKTFLRHKPLINELIRLEYIKDDDEQLIFYDSLFSKLVDNRMNYVDIYSAIHYVVPKVITRNFIDEDGKEIKNDDFEINDVKYKWLSYEEMINDERISKVNSDIIEFVRNIEESNERKTIMKNREVKPFSIWKHFKGTTAFVITVAEHSETNEKLVVYYCTDNEGKTNHKDGIYARPLDMFLSEVDHEKYPNVNQKYRFEEIDSENN